MESERKNNGFEGETEASFLRTSKRPAEIVLNLFMFINFLMMTNLLFCLKIDWNNFMKRLLAFKDLNSMLSAIVVNFASNDATFVYGYIHRITSDSYFHHQSAFRLGKFNQFRARLKVLDRNISGVFLSFVVVCGVLSYCLGIIIILKSDYSKISAQNLPFIMYVYYPENYRSANVYLIVQALVLFWYATIIYMWCMCVKAMLLSIECVTFQIDYLRECLLEIDEMVSLKTERIPSRTGTLKHGLNNHDNDGLSLRSFFSQIIQDHQSISSTTKMLNDKLTGITMGFMNIFGFQLCILLVFILEVEDYNMKLKSLFRYFLVLGILYICTRKCQEIQNKILKASYTYYNILNCLKT